MINLVSFCYNLFLKILKYIYEIVYIFQQKSDRAGSNNGIEGSIFDMLWIRHAKAGSNPDRASSMARTEDFWDFL